LNTEEERLKCHKIC
jgi:hypothetical protein